MEQIDLFDAPAPPDRQEEAAPDDGLDEMLATSARKTVGFPSLRAVVEDQLAAFLAALGAFLDRLQV